MPKETTEKELNEKNKKTNATAKSRKTTNTAKKKTSSKATKNIKTEDKKKETVASQTSKSSKTKDAKKLVSKRLVDKQENKKLVEKLDKDNKKLVEKLDKDNKKVVEKLDKDNKKVVEKNVQDSKKMPEKKLQEKDTKKEEKVKEQTVIEKIKAFIAKIVAMQEEARLEEENKNIEKKKEETKKEENKKVEPKENKSTYILEYYDLPYRYNETVVKILAQTPKRLFVYWDISDNDRQKYLRAFGERFFEETYPVLLVHNQDLNYTFEVPINDFANSWYLDINDSKAKYTIQLGRKFRQKPEMVNITSSNQVENVELHNDYVPIITSNMLEVPNDHILFENIQSKVLYRNVKNGEETNVDIDNLEFAKRMGHIYSIYDVYKEIYKQELEEENLTSLLNPSSMSSSVFR